MFKLWKCVRTIHLKLAMLVRGLSLGPTNEICKYLGPLAVGHEVLPDIQAVFGFLDCGISLLSGPDPENICYLCNKNLSISNTSRL